MDDNSTTTQAEIETIVRDFTREYIERRLLWQLGQIIPGADMHEQAQAVLQHLYSDPPAASLRHTMEPQEWRTMAFYGAGLISAEADEINEICQGLAEWLFAVPGGSYSYTIPDDWAEHPMGALWWNAIIRAQGDELITLSGAAEIAGVTVQAISQRIDAGSLRAYTNPAAGKRQGRQLVRRSDIEAIYQHP